ncbi:MAG TPA: ribonuclease P protein component [Ferruginibacter sp.]|nr:ribonuclease P protein component [Ferruginibacter sp.]
MQTKQRYRFGKTEKLKSRKAIENLFAEGKSFSLFPFRIVWKFAGNADSALQAGFTVSSKQFKHAVDRNRIKRLMKEAYRLQKAGLYESLKCEQKKMAVFFIYVGNELPDYPAIFDRTGAVIKRLLRIVNENPAADT